MGDVAQQCLSSVINELSDKGYEQSFAFYRLWFDIEHTYPKIEDHGGLFDAIWGSRGSSAVAPKEGELFHPAAHLLLRFASDAESDYILGSHNNGLQALLCSRSLRRFFWRNIESVRYRDRNDQTGWEISDYSLIIASNFVAPWANAGFVEETTIRNHILQSLISHPKLYDHQADALIVLFKIAGATLEAYAEPSVVDRCFELLKNHYPSKTVKGSLTQVRVPGIATCGQ